MAIAEPGGMIQAFFGNPQIRRNVKRVSFLYLQRRQMTGFAWQPGAYWGILTGVTLHAGAIFDAPRHLRQAYP
jgi:hypothetical protein